MLEKIENLNNGIIGVRAKGVISGKDYEEVLIPSIEDALKKYKKINLLYIIGKDFESYDFKAIVDDSKVGFMHFFDFNKIAIVTNKEWVINLIKAFAVLYPCEVKIFNEDEVDRAIDWVKDD